MSDATRIVDAIRDGESYGCADCLPQVYGQLKQLAARKLALEQPGQTLQATALVHEAYMRLLNVKTPQQWNGRATFLRRPPKRCAAF